MGESTGYPSSVLYKPSKRLEDVFPEGSNQGVQRSREARMVKPSPADLRSASLALFNPQNFHFFNLSVLFVSIESVNVFLFHKNKTFLVGNGYPPPPGGLPSDAQTLKKWRALSNFASEAKLSGDDREELSSPTDRAELSNETREAPPDPRETNRRSLKLPSEGFPRPEVLRSSGERAKLSSSAARDLWSSPRFYRKLRTTILGERSFLKQTNGKPLNVFLAVNFQIFRSILNPLKLGFLFGIFVDAFKVGS